MKNGRTERLSCALRFGYNRCGYLKNKVRTGDACASADIPGNTPVFPPWV
jgi:hypothetical protein